MVSGVGDGKVQPDPHRHACHVCRDLHDAGLEVLVWLAIAGLDGVNGVRRELGLACLHHCCAHTC
jgi:hypothetical protein